MTVQDRPPPPQFPVIPEGAPFSIEQRAWLNGFFAGLLSLEAQAGAAALTGNLPGAAAKALSPDGDDGEAPWHDPSLALPDRLKLAEGRPLRRKLFAAMAQQDCGQCGYLCETYAEALAKGEEKRQNLCVPGGKETSRMLKQLMQELPESAPAAEAPAVVTAKSEPAVQGYSREAPVQAVFRSATRLNGEGSEKDTRHVVFDISASGLAYEPGDSFGICPRNDPALVDAVLDAMRAPPDFPIGGKTFRETLAEDYALGLAPDMLFELVSYLVGGERRRKAKRLAKGEDPDGNAATLDVLEVLRTFGPIHPDPEAFLEALEPLQPRLYSISSSPLADPGEMHLTVDVVRYDINGRQRLGVASTFLSDRLQPGAPVKVYVQKAHGFALPADPATPIIMVGPGTGIAPFRSFLRHRRAKGSPGKSWLFFGHQRQATDFFYRDELQSYLDEGSLTRLCTAWSRQGASKVYVQDRMREAGEELWQWLDKGAHFYVCGDAKRMAKDVEMALTDIVATHGQKGPAGAKEYIAALKVAGRYQADVY